MRRLSSIVIFLFAFTAHALVMDEKLTDPAQEQQAQALFHALRCIVCEEIELLTEHDLHVHVVETAERFDRAPGR